MVQSLIASLLCAGVGVLHIEERHRGEVVIHGDGHGFGQGSGLSGQSKLLTASESVRHSFTFLRGECKVGRSLARARHALGDSKRPHHRVFIVEPSNYTAAQVVIELNS